MIFAAAMFGNAIIIIVATDVWSRYSIERELGELSPTARKAWNDVNSNRLASPAALRQLNREFTPIQSRLEAESNVVLYGLVALAAVITLALGYVVIGRLGRGLNSVAMAARNIADGDLTARAMLVGFASREETELIGDFNSMSSALQRAERELAESTASIAHELRTPLTILRGRLHGIVDGVFAFEPKEIRGLLYQVEGLGRLVDDLQVLSLANSQRLHLAKEPTDLAEEVRRVLASIEPDLIAAGLKLELALQMAPLFADGARIRQVVTAVLTNASRYAAQSGILRIETQSDDLVAFLQIIDNGPGLPVGSDGRAFDRFWRGETSRSRYTGGTGLGLSVVRAIVEAHGGSATLGNHAGGGALFEMRLPSGAK
jgi:two-component system, OmpR family, sensor histidine kinase AdeS